MTNQFDSPDALDEQGVLRPGQRTRVAMMARDAAPCLDCGWSHDIGIVCPTSGSNYTPKGAHHGDRASASSDAETLSDAVTEDMAFRQRQDIAGARPGFRFNTDAAAKRALADAYAAYDQERGVSVGECECEFRRRRTWPTEQCRICRRPQQPGGSRR